MKEDFLHYLWLHKKIQLNNLQTTKGESIEIINFGQYLQIAGPDFFNALLIIDKQKWAGNIEFHLKSSDWYLHNHENDSNYENVILHVVWEHNTEVYRKDNSEIPVLQLKDYVPKIEIEKYKSLFSNKSWINCENEISNTDEFLFSNWKERLFYERLERKSIPFEKQLQESSNDWENTLFVMLSKNFGLNINGLSFYELAKAIPFNILKKESFELENLEALFFGYGNLLEDEKQDIYFIKLQNKWRFLKQKHQLKLRNITPIQFFKLRPDNFPTIRLAQLAQVYFQNQNLFLQLMIASNMNEFYSIFNNSTSVYWINHYNFDRESNTKPKKLSKSFIDLVVINTIIPLKFLYAKANGKENTEELIELLSQIKSEKNSVIDKFSDFKIKSKNAFDTQTLLQLKNEYCNQNKCLNCTIGLSLLKK